MVAAPDQSGVEDGAVRFIMSLRAIGEGHRSSIEFRTGTVRADASIVLDAVSDFAVTGDRTPHSYDKRFFTDQVGEHADVERLEDGSLVRLEDEFTMAASSKQLIVAPRTTTSNVRSPVRQRTGAGLAGVIELPNVVPPSIDIPSGSLPEGPPRATGWRMPVRLLRRADDGTTPITSTYTPFDAINLPQLIETAELHALPRCHAQRSRAQSKGTAIFPRPIDGKYVASGRDEEHEQLRSTTSTDIRVWRGTPR